MCITQYVKRDGERDIYIYIYIYIYVTPRCMCALSHTWHLLSMWSLNGSK